MFSFEAARMLSQSCYTVRLVSQLYSESTGDFQIGAEGVMYWARLHCEASQSGFTGHGRQPSTWTSAKKKTRKCASV